MENLSFEDAFDKLESLVAELEGQDLGLDESLAKYEQAVKMLRLCYQILEKAEKKVELLTRLDDGSFQSTPFDAEESDEICEETDEAEE